MLFGWRYSVPKDRKATFIWERRGYWKSQWGFTTFVGNDPGNSVTWDRSRQQLSWPNVTRLYRAGGWTAGPGPRRQEGYLTATRAYRTCGWPALSDGRGRQRTKRCESLNSEQQCALHSSPSSSYSVKKKKEGSLRIESCLRPAL